MSNHTWVTEYIDAGMLDGTFWKCSTCDASGGPASHGDKGPSWEPFYADGSGTKLSEDCDVAKAQIQKHLKTWVPWNKRPTRPPPGVKVGPGTPRNLSDEDVSRAHEMADLGYQLWGTKYDHLDPDQVTDFQKYCEEQATSLNEKMEADRLRRVAEFEEWRKRGGQYNGG